MSIDKKNFPILTSLISKRIANTFSLKYRLETDSIRSAWAYSASGETQLAAPLWHIHICMLTGARLASFKCGHGLTINWLQFCGISVTTGGEKKLISLLVKYASYFLKNFNLSICKIFSNNFSYNFPDILTRSPKIHLNFFQRYL